MLLALENVCKSHGAAPVLQGLSFTLRKGGTLAVIGPSGCGKSTLLSLIAGLSRPDAGRISLQEGTGAMAYVMQDYGLFPWKTVEGNMCLPLALQGVPAAEARERCSALLGELGLAGLEKRWPAELSGGQRQRVALGRALMRMPSLLLLDEPFSSLDSLTRESMQDLILALREKHGFAWVLVTHSVAEALYLGESILPLSFGRAHAMMRNPFAGTRPGAQNAAAHAAMVAELRRALELTGGAAQ